MRLSIDDSGEAQAQLAEQAATKVSALKLEAGSLTGCFEGDIRTPDANKREYSLRLSLKRRRGHVERHTDGDY